MILVLEQSDPIMKVSATMAKSTATETPENKRGKSVAGTITPELHEALEEHRWSVRMTFSQLVAQALAEYARNHAVDVPESGE